MDRLVESSYQHKFHLPLNKLGGRKGSLRKKTSRSSITIIFDVVNVVNFAWTVWELIFFVHVCAACGDIG